MPTTKQLHDIWEMEFNHPWTRRPDDPCYVPPEKYNRLMKEERKIKEREAQHKKDTSNQ